MLKAFWVAEKPFSYRFPRPMENHFKSSTGIAGSFIIHVFFLSIGYSVALHINEPKMDIDASTFRWDILLATAPLPEPVTSDTPSPSPAVPPRASELPQSENADLSTPTKLSETSPTNVKKSQMGPSTELSVQSETIERFVTGSPVEPPLIHQKLGITPSRTTDSSAGVLQERTHTMPFTHGLSTTLPPPIEKFVDRAEQVRQPSTLEELRVLQRPRAYYPPVQRREIRPDYGWLIHDLRIKLERLKFYPKVARTNKWEGKVVVQMKILEGGHLIDMEIEESSGFEVLDQTALTIVGQASPLNLVHPLHASNVRLSVPLTFQLE
ncbi:MAG: TonB family protein [Nitrospira sp.]|nr:TonB family protein [Nitrospira sp.]